MGNWEYGDQILWRRCGERRWKKGTVRHIWNDAHGSVSLYDKHGRHASVPDDPACIRRRKK